MTRRRKMLLAALGLVLLAAAVYTAGRVRVSGGTWLFASAPLPEGWPDATPVGVVELKEYPAYRAASVDRASARGGSDPQFMMLFRHIQANDIAMTAPVEMGYSEEAQGPSMQRMSFLYRSTEQGTTGRDGGVLVHDTQPRLFASVGVRGRYDDETFAAGWRELQAWLAASGSWEAAGDPRYLGYNGPFTLPPLRYGEVQVAVRERAPASGEAAAPAPGVKG